MWSSAHDQCCGRIIWHCVLCSRYGYVSSWVFDWGKFTLGEIFGMLGGIYSGGKFEGDKNSAKSRLELRT